MAGVEPGLMEVGLKILFVLWKVILVALSFQVNF